MAYGSMTEEVTATGSWEVCKTEEVVRADSGSGLVIYRTYGEISKLNIISVQK